MKGWSRGKAGVLFSMEFAVFAEIAVFTEFTVFTEFAVVAEFAVFDECPKDGQW